jgi:hypothetical protein
VSTTTTTVNDGGDSRVQHVRKRNVGVSNSEGPAPSQPERVNPQPGPQLAPQPGPQRVSVPRCGLEPTPAAVRLSGRILRPTRMSHC